MSVKTFLSSPGATRFYSFMKFMLHAPRENMSRHSHQALRGVKHASREAGCDHLNLSRQSAASSRLRGRASRTLRPRSPDRGSVTDVAATSPGIDPRIERRRRGAEEGHRHPRPSLASPPGATVLHGSPSVVVTTRHRRPHYVGRGSAGGDGPADARRQRARARRASGPSRPAGARSLAAYPCSRGARRRAPLPAC